MEHLLWSTNRVRVGKCKKNSINKASKTARSLQQFMVDSKRFVKGLQSSSKHSEKFSFNVSKKPPQCYIFFSIFFHFKILQYRYWNIKSKVWIKASTKVTEKCCNGKNFFSPFIICSSENFSLPFFQILQITFMWLFFCENIHNLLKILLLLVNKQTCMRKGTKPSKEKKATYSYAPNGKTFYCTTTQLKTITLLQLFFCSSALQDSKRVSNEKKGSSHKR